jgi:hypothetical protein
VSKTSKRFDEWCLEEPEEPAARRRQIIEAATEGMSKWSRFISRLVLDSLMPEEDCEDVQSRS